MNHELGDRSTSDYTPLLTKLEAKQELKNERCQIDDRLTLMHRKHPVNLFPSYHFPSIPHT